MIQPCPGYDDMGGVVRNAPGDIRHHLWTLYWLLRSLPSWITVELGTRRGDSTRALMAAARDLTEINAQTKKAYVFSYDNENVGEHVKEVSRNQGFCLVDELWRFTHCDSTEAAKEWGAESVNMVFIDTDHSFDTTRKEIAAWAPKVISGGCMAFHDVFLTEPGRNGVRPAIEEYVNANTNWVFEPHIPQGDGDTGFGIMWRRS